MAITKPVIADPISPATFIFAAYILLPPSYGAMFPSCNARGTCLPTLQASTRTRISIASLANCSRQSWVARLELVHEAFSEVLQEWNTHESSTFNPITDSTLLYPHRCRFFKRISGALQKFCVTQTERQRHAGKDISRRQVLALPASILARRFMPA